MSESHKHKKRPGSVASITSEDGRPKSADLFGYIELTERFGGDEKLAQLAQKLAHDPNYRNVRIFYSGPATNKTDDKSKSINKYSIKFAEVKDYNLVAEGRAFCMRDATVGCRSALEKEYGNVVNDWFSNLQ